VHFTFAVYWASPGSQTWNIQKEYDYIQLHVIYTAPAFALWNTYKQMVVNNAHNPKRGLQRNIPTLLSKGKLKWISHFLKNKWCDSRPLHYSSKDFIQSRRHSVYSCLNITPAVPKLDIWIRTSDGWSARLNPLSWVFATVPTSMVFVKQTGLYNGIIHSAAEFSHTRHSCSNINTVLDFKLSPCCECCILPFGWFPGVWILSYDVSEHTVPYS